MAKFKITPTTTVAELKEQFSKEVGGVLRIYEGRSEAADGATLVSLGAKEGELECRTSRTVGKFEEAFQNDLNLKVKVYTKDNWVKALDGITLATAAELPNGMTKAKMEEYLSYKRDEKDSENENTSIADDWNTDTVKEVYKYMPLDELGQFLDSSYIQPKICDASDFPFISGENLNAAVKIVDGFCYCALCGTSNSESQWKTSGNDGHGVCVKFDVNYKGWDKASVFYSSLNPEFDNDYIQAVDALSIKPSEYSDMDEIIFVKKVSGNDGLPYRVQNVILGSNMTEEERQKCNAILSTKGISVNPNGMTKAKMEEYLSCKRDENEEIEEMEDVAPLPNPNAIYFVINSEPREISEDDEECGEDCFVAFRAIKDSSYFYGVYRYDPNELADELGVSVEDIELFDMSYDYDCVENYPSGKNIYLPKWLYELYTSPDSNIAELCPDEDSEPIRAAINCCLTNYSSDWVFDKEVPCMVVKSNGSIGRTWFAKNTE